MRSLAFALVTLLATATAVAQSAATAERHAWDWTLDEQLNERLDAAKIQERDPRPSRTIKTESISKDVGDSATAHPLVYSIDGRRNPELFLSFELFDMLLFGLASDETHRAKQRQFCGEPIRSLGYDEEMFWTSLASVSGNYLQIKNDESCADAPCAEERCKKRYDAMEAARRLFGRAALNRILYTVVAPTMQQSTATLDTNHRAALERQESGCR